MYDIIYFFNYPYFMKPSEFSFISAAEKLTVLAYVTPRNYSVVLSEVISRIAAVTLLSPAAGLDIGMHAFFLLPTISYAIGKALYSREIDFTLPWQHLQRIQNSVLPLLLGSAFGVVHPFAGIFVSEPTDKHSALSILYSDTKDEAFHAFCTPIDSLEMIEKIAVENRFAENSEIFPEEYIKAIQEANFYEKILQIFQGQEFVHIVFNVTFRVMAGIIDVINETNLPLLFKEVLARISGFCVPLLTAVDLAIALTVQSILLTTGVIRLICGRGPHFSEVTKNPLAQVTLLIQTILKALGNIVGTLGWIVSPLLGFKISLFTTHLFFQMQMKLLMRQIQSKLANAKESSLSVFPILIGSTGEHLPLSNPLSVLEHKTYLIAEKKGDKFNLYWVNRPDILQRKMVTLQEAVDQIQSMFKERYPFMDIERIVNYPVKSKSPEFPSELFAKIDPQSNVRNCVVSNLFGTFEAFDRIKKVDLKITSLRNKVVRESLIKKYTFYQNDFIHFTENFSVQSLLNIIMNSKTVSI